MSLKRRKTTEATSCPRKKFCCQHRGRESAKSRSANKSFVHLTRRPIPCSSHREHDDNVSKFKENERGCWGRSQLQSSFNVSCFCLHSAFEIFFPRFGKGEKWAEIYHVVLLWFCFSFEGVFLSDATMMKKIAIKDLEKYLDSEIAICR